MEAQYAIPKNVITTFEDDSKICQTAVMYSDADAELYVQSCRHYGASAIQIRSVVLVQYKKDADGKIGPKYS